MDIGKSIQKSFDLYLKNFGTLFLASLIAGILSAITFGILAGPLIGGVLLLCLKLLRGEKGELNEIFAHFDQFLPALLVTLMLWAAMLVTWVIGLIPIIGWVINLIIGSALGMLYFLTLGFVIDQKLKPLEALKRSIYCGATEPLPLWLYSLVIMILAGIGAVCFFIGVFLTMPFGLIGLTIAYQQLATKEAPPFKPEKQLVQIAGITLVVLFVAGLTCLVFGFGRLSFGNSGAGLAGKILSGATGQKVVIKEQGQQIKNFKIGNLTVSTGLPDNFPSDIPIYPKATVGGYLGGENGKLSGSTTTLTAEASAKDICDYYIANLKAQGWTVETSEIGDMKTVNFKKDNRSGGITINPSGSKSDILIGITTE